MSALHATDYAAILHNLTALAEYNPTSNSQGPHRRPMETPSNPEDLDRAEWMLCRLGPQHDRTTRQHCAPRAFAVPGATQGRHPCQHRGCPASTPCTSGPHTRWSRRQSKARELAATLEGREGGPTTGGATGAHAEQGRAPSLCASRSNVGGASPGPTSVVTVQHGAQGRSALLDQHARPSYKAWDPGAIVQVCSCSPGCNVSQGAHRGRHALPHPSVTSSMTLFACVREALCC